MAFMLVSRCAAEFSLKPPRQEFCDAFTHLNAEETGVDTG
jgi:hypothetical protein